MTTVGVVDYDLGNLPSVTKALERVGARTVLLSGPEGFDERLDAVVLPGVGNFGAGARNLADRGLDAPIKDWVAADRPFLGICVGMQLLVARSEEDPEARGLDVLPGECRRLHAPKVPHMGWNELTVSPSAGVLSAVADGARAYFVHSYHVDVPQELWAASTDYGGRFCAAVERGNLTAVQFHPEKSAEVGRAVLRRFVERL